MLTVCMMNIEHAMTHTHTHRPGSPSYLELLDVDVTGAVGVKQLERLPDLLLQLLGQLGLGAALLPRRGHRALQGRSLCTGRLVGHRQHFEGTTIRR